MNIPKARKLKSGNWNIQMVIDGKRISITAATEKECKKEATLAKANYLSGNYKHIEEITLSTAIDKYIESRSNILSPSTIRGYRDIQRTRFKSVMNMPIKDIDWQRTINLECKLCSPKTIKNAVGLARSVLKECNTEMPKVILPQIVPYEAKWLTPEQIPFFLECIKDEPYEIAALLALHSLRRSEILSMTKSKISNGVIRTNGSSVYNEHHKIVRKNTNKNVTSNRTIPIMIPRLEELAKTLPEGFIFSCDGKPLTQWINRVCRKNNLPEVGLHGLRHSFASLAYHLGLSERETMEIGGWADKNTMHKIYTHIARADIHKSTNKMADFYRNL